VITIVIYHTTMEEEDSEEVMEAESVEDVGGSGRIMKKKIMSQSAVNTPNTPPATQSPAVTPSPS